MKYRHLGETGIAVSEIGFGAWGIGGATDNTLAYGPVDDAESKRALNTAFEEGITFYDTADLYGEGHSEALIGEVFHARRSEVVIATKFGMGQEDRLSRQLAQTCLENSLRRLQTDYVDLYQLHSPSLVALEKSPSVIWALQELKAAGKIRAVGLSLKNPADGILVLQEPKYQFDVFQVNLNMIDLRAVRNGLLRFAADRGVGIIARTPFNFGFLAGVGETVKDLQFDPADHRSRWPRETLERWAHASKLFSSLQREKRTLAQLALQFCLSSASVSTVIPGILHPGEAIENAAASELPPLGAEEIAYIHKMGG